MAAPAQPQKPPEKSEFAGGPYRDSMGHSFKTSQALAGHIKQTGHMPVVAPAVMTQYQQKLKQWQEYLKTGKVEEDTSGLGALFGPSEPPKEPMPEEMKFKYHALNVPIRVYKNPNGSITITRLDPEDAELTGEGIQYYKKSLRDSIKKMIVDSFVIGNVDTPESIRNVLVRSGDFGSEEALYLTYQFQTWSGGGLGVGIVRNKIAEEDSDIEKFKDHYWKYLNEFMKVMPQYEEKYKEYKMPDLYSYKKIKEAIQPNGKIKLYRGIRTLSLTEEDFKNVESGEQTLQLIINNADSWTADEQVAKRFASGHFYKTEGDTPIVLEYEADPEDVIMGWPFIGLPGEAEFMLGLHNQPPEEREIEEESVPFKIIHWEKSGTKMIRVKIEKAKKIEKALYSSKKDKIYWDLTGRNDYAIEKQRGLTAPTAIAMAKAYIRGPYRIRITRTKRGYTLSLLPPEKMMISWLEKPVKGVKSAKGIQE